MKAKEEELLSLKTKDNDLQNKLSSSSVKTKELNEKLLKKDEETQKLISELEKEKKKAKKEELKLTGLFDPEVIAKNILDESKLNTFIQKYKNAKKVDGKITDGSSQSFIENYNEFSNLFNIFNTELMFQSMTILSRTKITDKEIPILKEISAGKENNIKELTDLVFYPLNKDNLQLQQILKEEHTNKSVSFDEMVTRDTEIYRNILQVKESERQIFVYTIIKLVQNIMNFNDSKKQIFFKNTEVGNIFFQFIEECKKRYKVLLNFYSFAIKQKHNIRDHYRKLMAQNKNIKTYMKFRQDTPNNNPRFDFAIDYLYMYLLLKYTNTDRVFTKNESVEELPRMITADGAKDKKEYYFFGPYDEIFDSKITNVEIANKMKDDIVEKMIIKKENVCILATGQSGSGKTSIMIYYNPKPEEITDGIIVELLNLGRFQESFDSIDLSMTNIYVKQGLKKSSQNDIKMEDYLITQINFKGKSTLEFKVNNRKWKNGEDEIGKVMNEMMKEAEEEPTSNNPDSSRSIKIFDLSCKFKDGSEVKLFACDLPGIENKFVISVEQISEFLQSYIKSKKYQTRDIWYDDYHCMKTISPTDKNLYDETFWKEFNENVEKYYKDTLFRTLYMDTKNTDEILLYKKYLENPEDEKLVKQMKSKKNLSIFEDILKTKTDCENCFACFYNKFNNNTKLCDKSKVVSSLNGKRYEDILEELEKKKEDKKKDVYLNYNILSLFTYMRQYFDPSGKEPKILDDTKFSNHLEKYRKNVKKDKVEIKKTKEYLQKPNEHDYLMFHAIFDYLKKNIDEKISTFTNFGQEGSTLRSDLLMKLLIWDINDEKKMNKPENDEKITLFNKYTDNLQKAIDEYTEIICSIHTIRQIVFNTKIRILEGYMINRSLFDMKVDIKELLMNASVMKDESIKKKLLNGGLSKEKEVALKSQLNGYSLGFDRDIFTYCRNTDLDSDIYTNFYKKKQDVNINGIIVKEIIKSLESPHLLNFVVFNVINTTEAEVGKQNNPPRPPYIDISYILKDLHYEHGGNKVKKQVGKLNKSIFTLLDTLKAYKFYTNNEIITEMIKNIMDVKEKIEKDMSYDTLYLIYLKPLLDYIKKSNALTLIGSLESTDSIQNITYDKYICSFSEDNKKKTICADEECKTTIDINNLPDDTEDIDKYFQKIKKPE